MRRFLLSGLLLGTAGAAPVKIEFWHAMDGVQGKVSQYARDFNASQDRFEVVPVSKGNYRELLSSLQQALKDGTAPALVQLEFTQIAPLAAGGQLADLSQEDNALKPEVLKDFYAPAWKAGEVNGKRFALPWNLSVPVLMFNAGTLKKAGVSAPQSWADVEAGSKRLTGGGKKPLVAVADAWTFEANVLSRGGSLVKGTAPNLNGPEAVEALTGLVKMTQAGLAQPRTLNDSTRAAFDFARGQNIFVLASVANWVDARKIPFFQLGIAPFPCQKTGCSVPLGGGALAVPRGGTEAQQAGAVAFWSYLMEPARLADWVKTTAYAPPRRSAVPLLKDWYAQYPQMAAAHAQMEHAVPRPNLAGYAAWVPLIEDALWKALNNKATPQDALDDAQKRALRP